MRGQPEVLLQSRRRPKLSIILLDWSVRESFHGVEYLNQQLAPREDYELVWVEFYGSKPERLRELAAQGAIDTWLTLGYPPEAVYHKHRAYNAGILAARGEVCVICDSDAIFQPTFITSLLRAFDETPYAVVHLDQVRNIDKRFYPFNYPTVEEVTGEGCINWRNGLTAGLVCEVDRLHRANYGACMAARRSDMLRIGGADEHDEYLGFCCGPYEMTFRLQNMGRRERWLPHEYTYHTWHPNTSAFNTEYAAPHDGRYMTLLSLHARATGCVQPYLPNPHVARDDLAGFLRDVAERPQPQWRPGAQPTEWPEFVYCADRNDRGYALYVYRGQWFGLPVRDGFLDLASAEAGAYPRLLRGKDEEAVRRQIDLITGDNRLPRHPGKLERFRRDLFGEPLHQLPRRAWRKVRRRLFRTA